MKDFFKKIEKLSQEASPAFMSPFSTFIIIVSTLLWHGWKFHKEQWFKTILFIPLSLIGFFIVAYILKKVVKNVVAIWCVFFFFLLFIDKFFEQILNL
jgi:uncharacterized protein (DUF983 family)